MLLYIYIYIFKYLNKLSINSIKSKYEKNNYSEIMNLKK